MNSNHQRYGSMKVTMATSFTYGHDEYPDTLERPLVTWIHISSMLPSRISESSNKSPRMIERPNHFGSLQQTSTRRPPGKCASAVVTRVTRVKTVLMLRRSRKVNGIPRRRKSRLLPRKPLHRLKMMTLTVTTVRLQVPLLPKADPAIAGVIVG
jgi:hypothetical protein